MDVHLWRSWETGGVYQSLNLLMGGSAIGATLHNVIRATFNVFKFKYGDEDNVIWWL